MKYIPADKLIAEIRKLRSESCISESDDYYEYAKSEVIDIIDTLQKELPTLQELDAAAIAYSKRVTGGRMYRDLLAGFIAGAEWMAEQLKEDEQ